MDLTTATPAFLDDGQIARNGVEAGLDEGAIQTLRELAGRIRANPQLTHAAVAAHHAVYETDGDYGAAVAGADAALGAEADVLHALFVLDSTRLTRERQAAHGVPDGSARAISERHGASWLRSAAERGHVGIEHWMPGWLRKVASGTMYRLGRLEFIPEKWESPFRAYKHVQTHEVIVLAEAGQRFATDGTSSWTSSLTESDDAVFGTPITPGGLALPQQVRLLRNEWRLALGPGDPVLDMHVPAEGVLTIDALRDALAQAEPFFERFYPDHQFVAYVCDSWLFSPQLEALLGDNSNILGWQREGYLLPGDGGAEDFLSFTFGARTIDPATAPRDTRLRRAVIAHLEQGGALSCGGYVLLRGDRERFGAQPYRPASDAAITRLIAPGAAPAG